MLNNFSVQSRLLSLSGLPAILFVVATIITLTTISHLVTNMDKMYSGRVLPLKEIKVVSDNYAVVIVDTFHKLRGGQLSSSQALRSIEEAKSIAIAEWEIYLSGKLTSQEQAIVQQIKQSEREVNLLIQEYQTLIAQDKFDTVPYNQFVKDLYETFDPLSEGYNELMVLQLDEASRLIKVSHEEADATRIGMIIASVVVVVAMLSVSWLIYGSIHRPLKGLRKTIKIIAQNADLTQRVQVSGEDELSEIGNDFNKMVNCLHNLVENLMEMICELTSTSNNLTTISSSMANTSQDQEQQTAMIATAVTQMSAAIQEVANNAQNTAHKAETSGELAEQGTRTITENIQSIERLAQLVADNTEQIQALNTQSNEINQVVLMIQGVAEQTNLLALNAAIEAARAGESGRGFAVVADEVRQLAHNTQKATESIKEMISKLQSMAQNAVGAMENAQSSATSSVEKANESAKYMAEINNAVNEIIDMNVQVSTATEEQTSVISEISTNINEFNNSIIEIAKNAQLNAEASNALGEYTSNLKEKVDSFKT
ncbi:methyl-accepting chemotaxis protein [Pseudoalteromonas obscura]|uniref:Methyl-accepting chemotaxis protein n=1 Tax=Pseudoalteromonas obscura TaxID=3048491 RepID=A0ABT7EIZ2_9GAMM|nr:methyl-accepting chemotaxis protein [Pseudoalteromonas sp. P94(2023)]MDK2594995.1 methyl-accepting chemotaxis protein [Pseudoalteromonas sp. P94(2023)]